MLDPQIGADIGATKALSRAGLVATVIGGVITGLTALLVSVSLGVLVFAGPAPSFTGNGIALKLASTAVTGGTFAVRRCFRGAVSGFQDHPCVVLAQGGAIATVVVIAAVSLALYSTGIEVAVGENLDLDGELRTAGIAYPLVGLGGGMVACPYPAVTVLGHRMGTVSRASAAVAAEVAVLTLMVGCRALTP